MISLYIYFQYYYLITGCTIFRVQLYSWFCTVLSTWQDHIYIDSWEIHYYNTSMVIKVVRESQIHVYIPFLLFCYKFLAQFWTIFWYILLYSWNYRKRNHYAQCIKPYIFIFVLTETNVTHYYRLFVYHMSLFYL